MRNGQTAVMDETNFGKPWLPEALQSSCTSEQGPYQVYNRVSPQKRDDLLGFMKCKMGMLI